MLSLFKPNESFPISSALGIQTESNPSSGIKRKILKHVTHLATFNLLIYAVTACSQIFSIKTRSLNELLVSLITIIISLYVYCQTKILKKKKHNFFCKK